MTARNQVDAFARLITAIEDAAHLVDPLTPAEREAYDDDAAMDSHYGENVRFIDEHPKWGKR